MQLPRRLFWLILALIPVAFLLHLGVQPFIDDEGNRAAVALEMLWSGNFVTPILHGDYYYNKPPLWNWILAASFYLHGGASEWAARLPSVLCLLGFAYTTFRYSRRHLSFERAFLVSLLVLTCGRIIFWESLLGLIDLCFSWVVYVMIMVIYHEGRRERWWRMFLISYVLMAVAFMLKGLPAIVFQGLTILVFLIWQRKWTRLFTPAHVVSGLVGVGLIALYYVIYHQYNPLDNVFAALFEQSGKRTALAYGWLDTVKHVAVFPFELFYHFLPWTLLIGLAFSKKNRERLRGNPYFRFCGYAFFVNLAIYWLSPNFYPRYILMLLPLGFTLLVAMIPSARTGKNWFDRILYWLNGLFILVLAGGALATLFVEDTQPIRGLYVKALLTLAVLLALSYYYWRRPGAQFFVLAAAFLMFRVGFNLLAIPPRAMDGSGQRLKTSSIDFGERWRDRELRVFNESHMEPATTFYIERATGRIIPRQYTGFDTTTCYIYSPQQYHGGLFRNKLDSFVVRHSAYSHYYVGRLRTVDTAEIRRATLGERPKF